MSEPKCPNCKSLLTYLFNSTSRHVTAHFKLNEGGSSIYTEQNEGEILEDGTYTCPECGSVLTETEGEAREILLEEQ